LTAARHAALLSLTLAVLLHAVPVLAQPQRKDLDALRSRIEKLHTSLQNAEENRTEVREELRESELAVSNSVRELRALTQRRVALRAELQAIDARTRETQAALSSKEQQLGRMLAASYRAGEPGTLQLVLSGTDPNQTARELHYLSYISRAHASTIEAARNDLERLAELQRQSRDKVLELKVLEKTHQAQHAELVRQQSARRNALERLSSRIRAQKQEVKTLERDEQRLSRLVEELGRVIAAVPRGVRNDAVPLAADGAFGSLRGRLRLPTRGVVTNRFGAARVEGGPSWKGVFIRAPAGDEVRAVAAGRVVFADWMRGVGNLLVVDHGQGYLTIYGNNESVYRSVGDEVRGGDVVASVGASGGTQETGLYFEIRHEGRAFDPMSWVALR
jgi:murein hydrolase activator